MNPSKGKNPRHQARLVQQGAQQQGVHGRNKRLSEEEHSVDRAELGDVDNTTPPSHLRNFLICGPRT